MNWKRFFLNSQLIVIVFGCSQQTTYQTPIRIAVAASSAKVLKEIALAYESEHHTKIDVITGSSGKLAAQIEQGAPFDIFLAADSTYIHSLFLKGVITEHGQSFTTNRLAVWSSSPIDTLQTLLEKATIISIANPQTAPFGVAALKTFKDLGINPTNLIYGSSIAQVNQYIANQNVAIAFTSSSSKSELERAGFKSGYWLLLDPQLEQHIVMLNSTKSVNDFYHYLFTDNANQILKKNGFNR